MGKLFTEQIPIQSLDSRAVIISGKIITFLVGETGRTAARGGDRVSIAGELLPELLQHSDLPAVLIALPSQEVVVATPRARRLLYNREEPIEGRPIEDFLAGTPSGGLGLMAAGNLTGYETRRFLRATGLPIRVWVHRISSMSRPFAVSVILPEPFEASVRFTAPASVPIDMVVTGSTDTRLRIEHLSADVRSLLGFAPAELMGRSLLALVVPRDVGRLVDMVARASHRKLASTGLLSLTTSSGGRATCSVQLRPTHPEGTFVFTIFPGSQLPRGLADSPADRLERFPVGLSGPMAAQHIAELISTVTVTRLSSRELEIVTALINGERVPAIAHTLGLSQGTVRNRLSAVYKKLAISKQQELIDLVRHRG